MSEGTDVNALQSLVNEYKRQKEEAEKEIEKLDGQISRLQDAYDSLTPIKERLRESKNAQKRHSEDDTTYHEWTGNIRNDVSYIYSSEVTREYKNYVSLVDDVHDEILQKIGTLKSQRASKSSLVGKLTGWIYNLDAQIRSLLN